eukprot:CAMPEP_0113729734 /NCGR_PEP_ID=MMETSP0038_2-20120614/42741_1 /TAXON_ID=2898 /ORGANISM="Cryptomonas paramecium" /LENGTH=91 /DNA_ID=CAMNT_0000661663 /DNA_START=584 /DNA_END=855 /DNA_ORIENTATION=+ /assembly_acc=CAM_ASM_000170
MAHNYSPPPLAHVAGTSGRPPAAHLLPRCSGAVGTRGWGLALELLPRRIQGQMDFQRTRRLPTPAIDFSTPIFMDILASSTPAALRTLPLP